MLLLFSLFFYAWGGIGNACLLLLFVCMVYALGRYIGAVEKKRRGISALTFAVFTSNKTSSSWTVSPTFTDQDIMVPSVILSPSLGIFISNLDILIILFFLILLYEQQATEKESFNLNLF